MYVPLGELLPGMGYLVRRLLENTSNESFLRHTFFDADEISTLLKEPLLQPEDGGSLPQARQLPPHSEPLSTANLFTTEYNELS
jgi:RHH-type proline utilization regulon transcriptional repressor/proline dehydrogenase/delta 1-pyrroline-5-carboxylate dehydrogenase